MTLQEWHKSRRVNSRSRGSLCCPLGSTPPTTSSRGLRAIPVTSPSAGRPAACGSPSRRGVNVGRRQLPGDRLRRSPSRWLAFNPARSPEQLATGPRRHQLCSAPMSGCPAREQARLSWALTVRRGSRPAGSGAYVHRHQRPVSAALPAQRRGQRAVLVGRVDLHPAHLHLAVQAVVSDQHIADRQLACAVAPGLRVISVGATLPRPAGTPT